MIKSIMMTIAIFLCLIQAASAMDDEDTKDMKIARAVSAAPTSISDKATVLDVDGSLLREGSNGWTCFPGVGLIPGDKHPMCNDAVWMDWMKAAGEGAPFSTDVIGYSYMLQGDALVNNNNPAATDPNDGGVWVQEGPHLMMLMPKEMTKNLPRDPFVGGPYVMWDGTSMVHVMVPVTVHKK